MNFWRKEMAVEAEENRADVIIQKKRRKQDPRAKGLSAVAIDRRGARSLHQRNEDRHVLEGTMATVQIGAEKYEVTLLNLSSNGVMIRFEGKVEIGQELRLILADCAPVIMAVRWVRRERIGLEFVAETVIIAEAGVQEFILKTIAREFSLSGNRSAMMVGAEKRTAAERHRMVWVAKLQWAGRERTARLRNISCTGAMIELSERVDIAQGSSASLVLAKTGKIKAKVRWAFGHQIGLEFTEEFDVAKLGDESCAELAPHDDQSSLIASKGTETFDSEIGCDLRIRLGNVENPHKPPTMEYGRLTLDEVYSTLYPDGRPG